MLADNICMHGLDKLPVSF